MRPSVTRWFLIGSGLLLAALAVSTQAGAEHPERYPYDPACPWGRLSDGHGMLIRCLDPAEASQLLQKQVPESPPAPEASRVNDAKSRAPTDTSRAQVLKVSRVGPVQADTGELPLAVKKLSIPKDRYIECVRKHGGLTEASGTAVVRFLVRERGRAEGVGVKSHRGMSQQAAQCIADVVDRRYVGYPAAPIVGATIPIELSAKN